MSADHDVVELITIGRASVDLYGEQIGGRLEDAASFAKYAGGSPANTAIGAARLGLRTALLTRVGNDHFGRFLREELAREKVDVRGVVVDQSRLTALAVLGIRDQEHFPLLFYRENCADMALVAEDIDADFVASAGAVLINGTHLSTPAVYRASTEAAKIARQAGRKVIFDIDYRPVLWGLEARDMGENRFVADPRVTERLQEVIGLCDLIVGTEEEFHVLGGGQDTLAALRNIRKKTSALLVCKRGPGGCVAFPGAIGDSLDAGVVAPGFPVEVFNVLGAGDAFMAGFLRGWLRGEPLGTCCRYGNACGALVVSRHGCAPAMPSWTELAAFLSTAARPKRLREDRDVEHVHWATTRLRSQPELLVLAMDHRSQFSELAAALNVGEARIEGFKSLCLSAVDQVAQGDAAFGLLLDGRYGMRALEKAADLPYWIGRPIEAPGSRPLEFEGGADVGLELRDWPLNHVVKCLVHSHPDDDPELRARQERQLLRLFDAARRTRHELLLEVIVSRSEPATSETIAGAIQWIYGLGVRPDWWKLEPLPDTEGWQEIERTITSHDPLCRGIVLLGLSAPEEALMASFRAAAGTAAVRGFAVGRTIFEEPARRWFSGAIDDRQAVDQLASNFARLVDAWRAARADAGGRSQT